MISNRLARFAAICLFFFIATTAGAATTTSRYLVLFDTDDHASTGCSVTTPAGTMAGIEQVMTTWVDTTDGTSRVTKVERQSCNGSALSAPLVVNGSGWGVPTSSTSGDMLIETRMPFAAFGNSLPPVMRLYFVVLAGNGDVASAVMTREGGGEIIWPPQGRHRAVAPGDGIPMVPHSITLDGNNSDWDGLTPFLSGAPVSGNAAERFFSVFIYPGNSDLFFNFAVRRQHGTAPVAVPDEYSVRQGRSINVTGPGVLSNDSDPNGLPLKSVLDTPPASGALVLKTDGGFNYTQNGTLVPTDSFQYRADNGSATSDPARVTLHVQPDSVPVAVNDAYTVAHGGTLTISKIGGVLANDHDADGDPMTAIRFGVTNPQHGTVTLNADGSFVYVHDGSNTLTDFFQYRPNDGVLSGNVATVNITIGADVAPVAAPDVYTVNEAATLNTNVANGVLSNDTDVDTPASLLTATLVTPPLYGQLTFHPDGTFTYVQDGTDHAVDTFTYKVADNIVTGNTVTVTINVTLLNDAPVAANDSYTLLEDTPLTVAAPGLLANDTDEESDPLTAHLVTQAAHGVAVVNANGGFTYTPNANYNGPDSFTYAANDGHVDSNTATVNLTVTAVNDVPSFTAGSGIGVLEDSGAYSAAWATNISAGPADEAGQALNFIVSNNNNALFTAQPAISAAGVLTFTPAPNANGSATVTVQLHDNGGVANGGVDTTASITFSITVTAVNDVPVFVKGANQTSNEDAGAQTVNGWATGISAGPADEAGQTLNFIVTNNNNALFSVQPSVNATTGTLTFTSAPNANGVATVSVQLHDNGGTANGGVDTSAVQTFTITVNGVNDAPVNSVPGTQTTLEDTQLVLSSAGSNAISISDVDANGGTEKVTLTAANGTMTLAQTTGLAFTTGTGTGTGNATMTFTGTIANINLALNGLTFLPSPNFNDNSGAATITITTDDQGNSGSGGAMTDTDVLTISVTPVNDAPIFTKGANEGVLEDTGLHTVAGWATGISAGAPDESAQTLTFNVTNDNNALFSVQPAIAANGNLTYTLAANASGSATVTVTLSDNGGTANGGANTSAPQTFTITVTDVNDVPSFTKGADQTVLEDSGAFSLSGWATAISAGPPAESGQTVNFIVSNNNNALFSGQPAIAANGTLTFTPAANANGTATVSVQIHDNGGTANGGVDTSAVQTFVVNVTAVNDAPSFVKGADQTVLEDSGAQTVAGWATALSAGPANESAQTLNFIVSNNNNALFAAQPAIAANGTLTYTPAANAYGTATVTVQIHDDGGTANGGADTSASQTFVINVTAVNDVPSFTKGADQTVLEDSGAASVPGWATGISAGPNEATQTVNFIVSNNNNALFSGQPAVSASGTLTYTPAPNANGSATVTIQIHDDGGTSNGGVDTSASQTFVINVTPVNDAPSFTKGADVSALEDSGLNTVNGWATALSAGPADEAGQTLNFIVTNDNNALFSVQPAISALGNLTYTTAANQFGTATVSVQIHDNGGVANGGVDTSSVQTFTITITGVNDAPSFAKGANQTTLEDSGPQTASGWATAISAGPGEGSQTVNFIVTNDNNGLFSSQPAIDASGNLTYTPAADANGVATVSVSIHDNGGVANGGVDTSAVQTFTISVTPVNDAPSFTKGADQTVLEDSGAATVNGWATAISRGPADEAAQTVNFIVSNDNNALFSAQPAVSATGTLTFTPAANAFGTATVSVQIHDDGGTANGGADTSAVQTFIINVTGVNDAPSFTKGADQTVLEDAAAQSVPAWATAISAGPNESGQTVNFIVTNNNNALFSVQPAVSATGTLTYTLAANANGTALVSVQIHDNGGTANGGVDTSAAQTFNINVTAVNDAPSFTKGADQTVLEDSGAATVAGWATALSAGPADEAGQTLNFIVSNNNNALFSVQPAVAANGTLTYTPAANAFGTATVSVQIHDNGGTANGGADTSAIQTFAINVTAVNDAPSFTKGADQTVLEDAAAQSVPAWATGISAGPNEGSQTVNFIVTNNNNALFSVQPAVSATGTLTYTLAANANGTALVSVSIHDDGGTANGGVDTSAAQTFNINVTAVNDAPSFTKGADQTVLEDSGAQTVSGWATALSAGPADESGQTLNFIVSNNNNALFSVQPAVAANGTLTYTPAANAFGTATVSVQIHDNGGTANGGADTSAIQTFAINVTGVNDAPSFTKGADQTVLEDAAAQSVPTWATGISAGPNEGTQTVNFIVTNNNNALFSVQPAVSATGTLTYTLAANANGTALVSVSIHDDGGTANGGVDTSAAQTFNINVTAVNDVPSFTKGADVTVNEDSGAFTQAGWATALSAGPADESGQALNFIVSNNNNSLFSVQPAVAANGTLTFTPAANVSGSGTVSVQIHDNGGVANSGVDTSAVQTFTITVNAVNDPPSFTKGANQTVLEDSGAASVPGWATAISPGPADESGQTVSFVVTNDNNALFSVQPAVASNGTLTYTLAANANGSTTVSIYAQDNGGTANGGVNISATQTFTITVTPVNDAPTFSITPPASPSPYFVIENSGASSLPNFISSISAGPANESSQTVTLSITGNTNAGMFSVAPAISNSGTLTFTLASNTGDQQTTLTFQAQDNGGTANGGVDLSSQTYVLKVEAAPKVLSTTPTNGSTVPTSTPIVITFSEAVNATASSFTVSCGTFTLSASPSTSFTLTPTTTWTGGTCNVTVVAANVTDVDAEDPPDTMAGDYNFSFTANTPPNAVNDTFSAIGNVSVSINAAQGLLANDSDPDAGQTISATAGTFTTTGGGSITIAADGSFTYHTAAGASSGTDTYVYTLNDNAGGSSTATVTFNISGRYIYVQHDAAAGGDGRDFKPYQTVTQAEATAIAGDTIFVLAGGAGSMDDGFTLKNNQLLIGQGIASSITTTLNGNTVTLLTAGSAPAITRTTAGVVATLASGNTIRGLALTANNGTALSGTSFGTLTTDTLSLAATSGPAMNLTTGSFSGSSTMTSVSSTNSTTNGMLLTTVGGSLTISGGTVSGSTTAGVNISGGTLTLSSAQNISASTGALVSISGSHATGTVTFSGTLGATGGTGLQLTGANGTYNFPGTTTLNGGSAQVNIGGTGTFAFASGMTVTNPAAAAFQATGSPNVTYSGSLAQNTANAVVSISAQTGGTIAFNTGTIASSASSTGVILNNADGTVNFNSASTTLSGVNGYAISNGSSGSFNFTNTHSISSSGTGFSVDTSSPTFTYPGSITANTAKAVSINAVSGGSETFSGNITSGTAGSPTGLGISVTSSTGGTVAFTGSSKSLFTSTNNAVTLTSNAGATVNFTGGGLAITTTTGSAYTATGGGTVNVTGAGNTITSAAAATAPLNINATTVGGSGVTFDTVNTTGATTGVSLTTIGAGTVTINGGTISGGTTGISMTTMSTGTLSLSGVTVTGGTTAISGTTFGTLSVGTTVLSATGQVVNLNTGTVNGTFTSITASAAGGAPIVLLTSVGGTFTVSGGTVAKTGGAAQPVISIVGGNAAITWQGSVTQSVGAAVVSVSGTHTGTLTFNTGTLTANSGSTGLQFAAANGTYSFANLTCTTCANAVNIGTSTGAFTFPSTFTPQNSTGTLITIGGTQPVVLYQAAVTQTTGATAVSITGVTGGSTAGIASPYSILFSGTIAKNTTAGTAVSVTSNTGGSFGFTGNITASTATANAISLATNTGATIDFTGILNLTTTTGTGFNATGGGTVTVRTSTTNVVTAVGGAAVNIVGTTIGGNHVTFKTINANGGASGIIINNTGASGHFAVTGGTSTAQGGDLTGGTIQNTTSHGIQLTSTLSPFFNNIKVLNTGGSGIKGPTANGQVTNFTLQYSTIDTTGTGGGVDEANVAFNVTTVATTEANVTGAVSIIGNKLLTANYHGIDIQQGNGTISALDISNNLLTSSTSGATSLGSGIRIGVHGSASTAASITGGGTMQITNNSINNFPSGGGIIVQGGNTTSAAAPISTMGTSLANPLTVSNNTITGLTGVRMATQGVNVSSAGHGTLFFAINSNVVKDTQGVAIALNAFGAVTASGVMNSNDITSNSNVNGQPGYNVGSDVQFGQSDTPNVSISMNGNKSAATQGSGILALARGNGALGITITNSNIAAPLGGVRPGIRVESGNNTVGENTSVCVDIRTNTSAGSGGTNGIGLRKQGTSTSVDTFSVEGMAATSSPGVEAYVSGLNPAGNGVLLISATSGFGNCNSAP